MLQPPLLECTCPIGKGFLLRDHMETLGSSTLVSVLEKETKILGSLMKYSWVRMCRKRVAFPILGLVTITGQVHKEEWEGLGAMRGPRAGK